MIFLLLASFGLGMEPEQDPLSLEEVRRRVGEILGRSFSSMDNGRKQALGDRLFAALRRSPSGERTADLLRDLPHLAEFRSVQVEYWLGKEGPAALPQDLLREGYDLQADIMVAEVERAASNPRSPNNLRLESEQLELIFTTAQETLRERLPGEAGAALVQKELEAQHQAWTEDQSRSYAPFLDRPLSTPELEHVLEDIRERGRAFAPIRLTPEQAGNPSLLKDLGVPQFLQAVIVAADGATRLCFAEFDSLDAKAEEWSRRANPHYQAVLLKAAKTDLAQPVPRRMAPLSREEKATLKQSSDWRADRAALLARSKGKGGSLPAGPEEGESRRVFLGMALLVIAASAALAAHLFRRRSKLKAH